LLLLLLLLGLDPRQLPQGHSSLQLDLALIKPHILCSTCALRLLLLVQQLLLLVQQLLLLLGVETRQLPQGRSSLQLDLALIKPSVQCSTFMTWALLRLLLLLLLGQLLVLGVNPRKFRQGRSSLQLDLALIKPSVQCRRFSTCARLLLLLLLLRLLLPVWVLRDLRQRYCSCCCHCSPELQLTLIKPQRL
jgi:hypothetical protein